MLLALLLCVAAAIDCCRGGSVVFLFQWVCLFVCLCVKAALIERCQCLLLKSVKVFAVVWQIDGEAWCCFASVCFVAHGTSESLSLSVV